MIIDAHTHIGDFVKISMPEDVFLVSLDKYNIDFALLDLPLYFQTPVIT